MSWIASCVRDSVSVPDQPVWQVTQERWPNRMPRKIRELIRDLEAAGFVNRGGKGGHKNFVHARVAKPVTVAGKAGAGADAKRYQEKAVCSAIEESRQ